MNSIFLLIIAVISFQGISSLTEIERQEFLDQHNDPRRQVAQGKVANQPAAANMIKLRYDTNLENKAQTLANKCLAQHDTAAQRGLPPYNVIGQNLYTGSNIRSAVPAWFSENIYYNYDKDSCIGKNGCKNYTQLVSAKTDFIGCAYANCKGKASFNFIVICNYAEGSNSKGAPYTNGTACSSCDPGYNCSDSLCVVSSITDAERQAFLDQHNDLRRQVAQGKVKNQPTAGDIIKLRYDTNLEKKAQNWANQCILEHDKTVQRMVPGYMYVGQNLYAGSTIKRAVQAWFDEHSFYTYANGSCLSNRICGHYTQVVWSSTAFIGCAYANCKGKIPYSYVVICNYGEGGNNPGVPPYTEGESECDSCFVGYDKCSDFLCEVSDDDFYEE